MKLTEQKLQRIIQEELQKLNEVMYGVDRFYVVVSENKQRQKTVARDLQSGVFAHKITKAERFETKDQAQKALERYKETPYAPDPRSKAQTYVAKVRAELERV